MAFKAYENNLTPFTLTLQGLPDTNDLMNLVYDTLFWSAVKGTPEPWLAESALPNADSTVWTVQLRAGLLWQDGRPLTSDDVAFTFDYFKRFPAMGGRYGHHVFDTPPYDHAQVVSPTVVRLYFKAPAPSFMILPGADLPIIPRHVWESVTVPNTYTTALPVGSGPFQVVQIVPDQMYRLVANDHYFKGRPLVDELDIPIIKDPTATFAALLAGQIDSTTRSVPPELLQEFQGANGITVLPGTRWESISLYFNTTRGPLSDPRVRKAISMGIDEQGMVSTVLQGQGQPGRDSWVHPDSAWAEPGGTHQYDPAQAATALDTAGFSARDGDGVRKNAAGVRLDLNVMVSVFEPMHIRAAQLAAHQVSGLGVRLNVTSMDPAAMNLARNAKSPTYDAFISVLESHAHADPDALYFFFHSPGKGVTNAAFGGWSNATFDSLVEQAKVMVDVTARKQLLNKAQDAFAHDAPALVLFYPNGLYAFRPAAYGGWISDPGQGIFTKRSFLTGYALATPEAAVATGSRVPIWAIIAAIGGVVFVGIGARLRLIRRRRGFAYEA